MRESVANRSASTNNINPRKLEESSSHNNLLNLNALIRR